jgi:hypothetical protein
VVSEGVNSQPGNVIGSNTTSYVLSSLGTLSVANLGSVGQNDLVVTNSLDAADVAAYQFQCVSNEVGALEVQLENVTGNPTLNLLFGLGIPNLAL